jgi:hypothetical protein
MKKHYSFFIGLILIILAGGYVDILYAQELACSINSDCKDAYYCARSDGSCAGNGVCVSKPVVCPDIYAPVCGCDGVTYGNKCEAAAVGVSVAHEGECPSAGYYCDMDKDGFISRTPYVFICSPFICGPPGCRTFPGNDCDDSNADINPEAKEICDTVDNNCDGLIDPGCECRDNSGCDPEFYCAKKTGECDSAGMCIDRPKVCPLFFRPVCGCDGRTYGNQCEAAAAGVSVANEGACKERQCFDGIDNDSDGFPDCEDSDCNGATGGVCKTGLPGVCGEGILTCMDGKMICAPLIRPGEKKEICNGLDDDCDGEVDEIDPVVLCPVVIPDLHAGFNLVGGICTSRNITAFQLLEALGGEDFVSSIMRYDPGKGAFETAGYSEGKPAGVNFQVKAGEGYFIYMKKDVTGFNP